MGSVCLFKFIRNICDCLIRFLLKYVYRLYVDVCNFNCDWGLRKYKVIL